MKTSVIKFEVDTKYCKTENIVIYQDCPFKKGLFCALFLRDLQPYQDFKTMIKEGLSKGVTLRLPKCKAKFPPKEQE